MMTFGANIHPYTKNGRFVRTMAIFETRRQYPVNAVRDLLHERKTDV